MSGSKPDWVPDWAWDEYLQFIKRFDRWMTIPSPRGGSVGENMTATAKAVFLDKGCGDLWPTMNRRASEYKKRWRERQVGLPEDVRRGDKRPVVSLLFAIEAARHGAAPHERTSASERVERGTRIARLARELKDELASCTLKEWGLPYEFDETIKLMAGTAAGDLVDVEQEWFRSHGLPASQDIAREKNDALRAIQFSISNQDANGMQFPALTAIERGALAWASSEPALYRPNIPNADRLYFVRAMTYFFRENYGTPLRGATAALTRCLFACEMDASTVAKLAP